MIVEVTYVVELEVLEEPITQEVVESVFAAHLRGDSSYNDRDVSLTWKLVRR